MNLVTPKAGAKHELLFNKPASVLQIKTKIVSCHTAKSKPVKQEVNGTMILPPLLLPYYRVCTLKPFQPNLMFASHAGACP
jgi:hypothetical protein